MKTSINKILGEDTSTEQDIEESEANNILTRIVGGDAE